MINYPISFYGSVISEQGINTLWESEASNFKQVCAVPKEFEGPGKALCPEDYFLKAVQNCFTATFKVYAEYSKLNFKKIEIVSELVVNKNPEGKPVMKTILLKIGIKDVSDEKKAKLLTNKVIENGFILQSVKSEIITKISFLYDRTN